MKVILLGNAGSGKSTLSRLLSNQQPVARLSLDEVAFRGGTEGRPLQCNEPQMPKTTIRYVLVATAMMAVCLAVHQIPPPSLIVSGNGDPTSEPPYIRLHHILTWFSIHFGAFFVGTSTLMHLVTSIAGLTGWRQGLTAICVPTFALTAWYGYSVRYLNHHPGSLDGWGHVQFGLIGFTIGFAVVTGVVSLFGMSTNQHVPAPLDTAETSLPSENVE